MSPEESAALTKSIKQQVEELLLGHQIDFYDCASEYKKYYEFYIEIPSQKNFIFEMSINLQNQDEIHFNLKDFTASYFPVSDQAEMQDVLGDLDGLINGSKRIVCYYYNEGSFCDSTMQTFEDGSWEATRSYGRGCNPFWFLTLRPKSTPENTIVFWNNPENEKDGQ